MNREEDFRVENTEERGRSSDDILATLSETVGNRYREEDNKERKEPTEVNKNGEGSEKMKQEVVCVEKELKQWSTQPVTNLAALVEYELEEPDFQSSESVGESASPDEITLSPRESSNKSSFAAQVQMQTHGNGSSDEEVMQDGISLSDLEYDLHEEQCSSCSDLTNELKP